MTETRWQQALADVVTDVDELLDLVGLSAADVDIDRQSDKQFSLRVPRHFITRMRSGDVNDPLLRQVLPVAQEHVVTAGYVCDPLDEQDASPVPGLLHKYHGRVLLMLSGGCAVNCRYCFRRHFPYEEHVLGSDRLTACLQYIKNDSSIKEVILSGGEPLLIKDQAFLHLIQKLADISHVKLLRIHTRMPIVIPERITQAFLDALVETRLKPVLVLHTNHPNELDEQVNMVCQALRTNGVTLLNQAVLLRGINDSESVLINLSERLFECGILPYYLHRLDRVQGAAHFDVELVRARELVQAMQEKLPGYLVPKFVAEVPKEKSKIEVA